MLFFASWIHLPTINVEDSDFSCQMTWTICAWMHYCEFSSIGICYSLHHDPFASRLQIVRRDSMCDIIIPSVCSRSSVFTFHFLNDLHMSCAPTRRENIAFIVFYVLLLASKYWIGRRCASMSFNLPTFVLESHQTRKFDGPYHVSRYITKYCVLSWPQSSIIETYFVSRRSMYWITNTLKWLVFSPRSAILESCQNCIWIWM